MAEYFRKQIFRKKDRIKKVVCVILGVCTALLFTGMIVENRAELVEAKTQEVQQELAEEVFRFHVLANSDSKEDQEVKLLVRDRVLSYMKESMEEDTDVPEGCAYEPSAESTKKWACEHLEEIEGLADEVLREQGFGYQSEAEVTTCYFPEKRYGDITFPCGEYEALRIKLGRASGHNWWCVLYPNLCFISQTCAYVSEEGKEELKDVLEDEEYELVTAPSEFKVRWFFFGDRTEED